MRFVDTWDAICVRPNGPGWEAIAGDKSAAGNIVRTDMDLGQLLAWLRVRYPTEPVVVLPAREKVGG